MAPVHVNMDACLPIMPFSLLQRIFCFSPSPCDASPLGLKNTKQVCKKERKNQ